MSAARRLRSVWYPYFAVTGASVVILLATALGILLALLVANLAIWVGHADPNLGFWSGAR
jgi:hypothetical protein